MSLDRPKSPQSAPLGAGAASANTPAARTHGGPVTRRWTAQRWLLDNTIRSVGMDWDQPRSLYLSAPCGPEANADFAGIRQRITKLADASPAFEAVARRREAKAEAAEQDGNPVTARENYFMAAIHWAAAQWPIDENNEQNRCYKRKKYMSGITDEARFNEFRQSMTWEGHADRIRVPYLCVTGEFDELSPLEHTERLMNALQGPKRLVVYQDSRHSVGNVPAANLGPFPPILMADWMTATLNGASFPSEKWYVEASGRIVKTAI